MGCVLCPGDTRVVEAHTELMSEKMVRRKPEYLKNICMWVSFFMRACLDV